MTDDRRQRTKDIKKYSWQGAAGSWQLRNDSEARGDEDAAKKKEIDWDSLLMVFLLKSGF
jgi:hypothetical protein